MISKIETVNALARSKVEPEVRPEVRPEVGVKLTGNRTSDPNIALPNSTSECWSILQHWLHFSPFFFERSNTNNWIWNLLTRTLFNMICRSSNDTTHYIYCPWQSNSTMMISFRSLFLAPQEPRTDNWNHGTVPDGPPKFSQSAQGYLDFLPTLTLCSVFINAPVAFVLWCNGKVIIVISIIQLFKVKNIYGPGRIKIW